MPISPFSLCWRLPKPDKSAAALAQCNAAKADLEFQLEELGHDISGFESEIAAAAQVRVELENEIVALNAQVAMLQAQLTENEAALQEELNTCNINKANVEASLFSANLQIGTLNANLAACEVEAEALQNEIDDLNTQIGTLNNQISTLQYENSTLQADKTALQSQITSLNSQITTLNNDKTALQSQVTSLNSQITQLNADKTALQSQVTTLQADKTALQNQVNDLNAQIAALNASNVKKIINSDAFLGGTGSLSFWIYPKSNNLLVEFHYNTGNALGYYLYGNQLVYRSNASVNTQLRTEVLNTWVFWQFIANGGITYKVYRNGVFINQTPTNYGVLATMCKISHQLEADVRNLTFSSSTAVLAVPTRE